MGIRRIRPALLAVAYLPLLTLYALNLWRFRPHYEFFPFVLIAFGVLLWKRWPSECVEHTRFSRVASWVLLWAGLVNLACAVILFSPWLASFAAVLTAGGVMLHFAGVTAWRDLLPVWLMLWLIVHPPWRLDDQLIQLLQSLTSAGTSQLLDMTGVHHLRMGNVFELPAREFFVAEACSGVHSQFVLIAVCVFWIVLERRPWVHALVLLVSAVFWSIVVNTIRVSTIVYAFARWELDWSTGWQHETLGLAVLAIGFLLLLGTDQFLKGLLSPIIDLDCPAAEEDDDPDPMDVLPRLWNRLIAGVEGGHFALASNESDLAPVHPEGPGATEVASLPAPPGKLAGKASWYILAFCSLVLGVLQLSPFALVPQAVEIDATELADACSEAWLPATLDSWQRTAYEKQERDQSSDEGMFSHIWSFRTGSQTATVALDFPFVGWHELTRCYRAKGWRVNARTVRPAASADAAPYVEVELNQPGGEVGLLRFCLYDAAGQPLTPRISHWRGLRGKLADSPWWQLLGGGSNSPSATVTTLQMRQFLISNQPFDEQQRQHSLALFLRCRDRLRAQWFEREGLVP